MKLRSFGCSFIYGSDLSSPNKTWPSLIAKRLGLDHVCHAQPGVGNLQIMEAVMQQSHDDLFVINWTWIDRFDFIDISTEKWQTLRPALDHVHAEYYFRNMHSQYRDMLTNLTYIKTALDFLMSNQRRFVMTAMDDLLFETVQETWHQSTAVSYLQTYIRPWIKTFDGKNFLQWSKSKGYAISEKWHPLDDAHAAASNYFIDATRHII